MLSYLIINDIIPGVSGRLDDDYLAHKLEQGCLADLENCHIKEEVVIIIISLQNCPIAGAIE